ncbi:hypothetical protein L227DRAFT_23268 [Lentinus tigrinus ALCF2SS1-6]|uniref:Uncharacterized protein n=1 Tax=Lentinus tigrinus ALCF2SS1-6 TaxID=1328759 RepID=A0A5C2STX3_9APHY|nr:hypothetical protein L227DRAFT_23268 [Lentinus tigrinus ALCF2SS1-6]
MSRASMARERSWSPGRRRPPRARSPPASRTWPCLRELPRRLSASHRPHAASSRGSPHNPSPDHHQIPDSSVPRPVASSGGRTPCSCPPTCARAARQRISKSTCSLYIVLTKH